MSFSKPNSEILCFFPADQNIFCIGRVFQGDFQATVALGDHFPDRFEGDDVFAVEVVGLLWVEQVFKFVEGVINHVFPAIFEAHPHCFIFSIKKIDFIGGKSREPVADFDHEPGFICLGRAVEHLTDGIHVKGAGCCATELLP
jgi:hypothetical protein